MDLDVMLLKVETQVIDEAYLALQRSQVAHYETAGESLTRQRLTDLFHVVVVAIRDRDLTGVGAFSERIADERFNMGFDVSDVQTAFNALEVVLWRRVVADVPPAELAEAVGLLSTVLGFGKDVLARRYVSLASSRHVHSLDLSALFGGTDA